ncbi:MAG TPA: hypothetical protein VH593_25860 [Ktedonobacteraceae bacterium]|jgi:hypothetical protein
MTDSQASASQERSDRQEDFGVALVSIGTGVVMALILPHPPASFGLWNTVVGITFLCLLQAYIPRPAAARTLCAAYAATWAITLISIFGVLLDGVLDPTHAFAIPGLPVSQIDLALFVLWGLIFGLRFLSLTRPNRGHRVSPSPSSNRAPEPNPPSSPVE